MGGRVPRLINLAVFMAKTPLVSRQTETKRADVKPAPQDTQGGHGGFTVVRKQDTLFLYVIYSFIIKLLLPSPVLSLPK